MATSVEIQPLHYNKVAASQTAQKLIGLTAAQGSTVLGSGKGAAGDDLEYLLIVPASTSPGAVTILDGTDSINLFAGGAGSVADLKPFVAMVGSRSINGAWSVTTGAGVSVMAFGRFT